MYIHLLANVISIYSQIRIKLDSRLSTTEHCDCSIKDENPEK